MKRSEFLYWLASKLVPSYEYPFDKKENEEIIKALQELADWHRQVELELEKHGKPSL